MKSQTHLPNNTHFRRFSRRIVAALFALSMACGSLFLSAAPAPNHGVVAANIDVTINSFDNDTNAVTLTTPYRIGDFRAVYGNNGDYDVQIGTNRTDDVLGGILISSVRENGRDDGHLLFPGTNLCTSHIDYHRPGATNADGTAIGNSYWIPVSLTRPNALGTAVGEWDINLAAAWFSYDKWIAGFARNSTAANGGAHDLFSGSPGVVLNGAAARQGSSGVLWFIRMVKIWRAVLSAHAGILSRL